MIKQVIIIRKDLKMRRGKEIAQGSHASMAWLSNRVKLMLEENYRDFHDNWLPVSLRNLSNYFSGPELAWLNGSFTKITLQVNSEEELLSVYEKAKSAGLLVEKIIDAGRTEFSEPTLTCIAIGPDDEEKINAITGELKLY